MKRNGSTRERSRTKSPARLLVVDDHYLARAGLQKMLAGEPDLEVVAEASDGTEALALCRKLAPDLVLMDVRMPEMDGIAATRAIKSEYPNICVIMVTMYVDPDYLFDAIKAGAAGYVLKDATRPELIAEIRKAIEGESPLNRDLATKLLLRLAGDTDDQEARSRPAKGRGAPLPDSLTAREVEVLRHLARGQTNRKIAEQLTLSSGTVKNHVQHIISKLGVSDRTQAAVRAVQSGLLASE
jgi:DNA-binding NarL/FixJ family response regulator